MTLRRLGCTMEGVDRASAIRQLPEPYAVALELHDEGHDDLIADRLGIDTAGVPSMLRLATAKLARLMEPDGPSQ